VQPGRIPTEIGRLPGLTHLGLHSNRLAGEHFSCAAVRRDSGAAACIAASIVLGGGTPTDSRALFHRPFDVRVAWQAVSRPKLGNWLSCRSSASTPINYPVRTGTQPSCVRRAERCDALCWETLAGPIPTEIGRMTQLDYLLLYKNQLSGACTGIHMGTTGKRRILTLVVFFCVIVIARADRPRADRDRAPCKSAGAGPFMQPVGW
jgi:hypothetical protein